jgi:hypothetical protein
MTKRINICNIPSSKEIEESNNCKYDGYYTLPEIIECFIDRANQELPKDYYALPWTINRAVTIFHHNQPVFVFYYEYIENDIVGCLNELPGE